MKTYMRISLIVSICLFVGLFLLVVRAVLAENPDGGWQTVAPGIEYQEFYFPETDDLGPNDVYVARMERDNPNVTIDSMISNGNLSGGTEQVSGMFNRYEGSINYWGQSWGKRNDVVVAINGYYYGSPVEPPGVPWRGQIHSGWYDKRHDDNENGSGFVWQLDGDAFIGECVFHEPSEQIVAFSGATTSTIKINDINAPRGEDDLILYTPQYDQNTLTDDEGVEILVEMTRPTLILPPTLLLIPGLPLEIEQWLFPLTEERNPESEAIGYVRQILDGQGSTTIPFDHIVLSATGLKRTKLLENLQPDMEIGISQAVNHLSNEDCATPITDPAKDWTKTYASIGGAFYFLENELINSFPGDPQATVHDARTAIAYNEDYIFFIVVDQIIFGDDPGDPAPDIVIRAGMNMAEIGYFARETLGADFGIAQDGGGSTTMVVNGEVKNVPNDVDSDITVVPCNLNASSGGLDPASFLPIIIQAQGTPGGTSTPSPTTSPTPTPSLTPTPTGTPSICYQGTERFVANGMMMVVVDPMSVSTTFTPTQIVNTSVDANLRLGPGTNYAVLTTIPAGSPGTVLDHLTGLNGVLATSSNWWKVDFGDGQVGWISESVLTGGL
jgi:hypothetical protein